MTGVGGGSPQRNRTAGGGKEREALQLDSKNHSSCPSPRVFSEPSYSFISAHLLAFVHHIDVGKTSI